MKLMVWLISSVIEILEWDWTAEVWIWLGNYGCNHTHISSASQKKQRETGNRDSADIQWRAEEPIQWRTEWTATGKRKGTCMALFTTHNLICFSNLIFRSDYLHYWNQISLSRQCSPTSIWTFVAIEMIYTSAHTVQRLYIEHIYIVGYSVASHLTVWPKCFQNCDFY